MKINVNDEKKYVILNSFIWIAWNIPAGVVTYISPSLILSTRASKIRNIKSHLRENRRGKKNSKSDENNMIFMIKASYKIWNQIRAQRENAEIEGIKEKESTYE